MKLRIQKHALSLPAASQEMWADPRGPSEVIFVKVAQRHKAINQYNLLIIPGQSRHRLPTLTWFKRHSTL